MLESRTLTCQLADTGVFLPSLAVREMTPAGTACLGPPLTVSLDPEREMLKSASFSVAV